MKPGAGDDLLSDDGDDDDDDVQAGSDETTDADAGVGDLLDDRDAGESDPSSDDDAGADDSSGYSLPWIHRRDTVKSDRSEIIQIHARQPTVDGEDDLLDDVEDLLGEDVFTLDLREAAYLVAMQHPDEVADQLREWGYDLE